MKNKCLKSVTKQNDPNQGRSDQIKVQESKLTKSFKQTELTKWQKKPTVIKPILAYYR